MAYGIVYLLTNKLTGKKYVGQTTLPLSVRLVGHESIARRKPSSAISKAISSYGMSAFSVDAIGEAKCSDSLNKLECEMIVAHRSLSPEGYNLTGGGQKYRSCPEVGRKISCKLEGSKFSSKRLESFRKARRFYKLGEDYYSLTELEESPLNINKLSAHNIMMRINRLGWSVDEALSKPLGFRIKPRLVRPKDRKYQYREESYSIIELYDKFCHSSVSYKTFALRLVRNKGLVEDKLFSESRHSKNLQYA